MIQGRVAKKKKKKEVCQSPFNGYPVHTATLGRAPGTHTKKKEVVTITSRVLEVICVCLLCSV